MSAARGDGGGSACLRDVMAAERERRRGPTCDARVWLVYSRACVGVVFGTNLRRDFQFCEGVVMCWSHVKPAAFFPFFSSFFCHHSVTEFCLLRCSNIRNKK
jgi:hypothetical protein